jgi:hypothetical protein
MHGSKSKNALGNVTLIYLGLALAACNGNDGNNPQAVVGTSGSATTGTSTGSASNTGKTTARPPTIFGFPNRQALANQLYSFRPVASDPDGDPLQFGIANQPGWSSFNATTGEIRGTPTGADVGVYRGITVTVAAAGQMRALAFDLEVVAVGTQSITLAWLAPTENDDGTPLTNLAGYRIRYGQQSGNYTSEVTINNPGLATYVLSGLAAGRYYLVLSAVNTNGGESQYSNEASVAVG